MCIDLAVNSSDTEQVLDSENKYQIGCALRKDNIELLYYWGYTILGYNDGDYILMTEYKGEEVLKAVCKTDFEVAAITNDEFRESIDPDYIFNRDHGSK